MNRMVFYLKCTLFQKKKYICSIARIIARNILRFLLLTLSLRSTTIYNRQEYNRQQTPTLGVGVPIRISVGVVLH